MPPRLRGFIAIFLVISLAGGCAYVPTRSLEYDPIRVTGVGSSTSVLVIRNLAEARSERYYPSGLGRGFLTYVPLIPYVKIPYERLDESDQMHRRKQGQTLGEDSHFTVAMTKVIAADLEVSGLFREVRYIGDDPVSEDADFVLEGDLESTQFDTYLTSYMLGMAGVLLWLLPIPLGKNEAAVEASLRLSDRDGQEVWSGKLNGAGARIFTFYNSGGAAVTSPFMLEIKKYSTNDEGIDGASLWAYHASALRSGMAEVKASLAAHFRSSKSKD
jgi:hypothetical protein